MPTQSQQEENINKQIETIKKILPPFGTGSTIFAKQPNKLYSKEKVRSFVREAIEWSQKHDMGFEFEARLNEKGMNGNNGDNEDKRELFEGDLIDSFID